MNTVAFHTFGCKLNFSETSTIARKFKQKGYKRISINDEFTLQKLVNRSMKKYVNENEFKTLITEYNELQSSGSNF